MGEEEAWLERLAQGDSLALHALMDAYGDVVLRTAYLLLGDRHLAEDISQEVFITVYRKHHQLKQVSRLQAWIVGITMNRCRAWMRRSSWKRLFYRGMIEEKKVDAAVEDHTIEVRLELKACLQYLPYKYREVITLHYYHDWSSSQIAETLGISEGTVKSQLSRARQQLKGIMLERGWEL